MARIAMGERTEVFCRMADAARAKNERNDCAVKAVAVVCGVTYDEAHAMLKSKGRKDRQGTDYSVIKAAVIAFGKKPINWGGSGIQDFIQLYPGRAKNLKTITTHHPVRYKKVWEEEINTPVLIFTRGHVAAYRDGKLHDWSVGRALQAYTVWSITE